MFIISQFSKITSTRLLWSFLRRKRILFARASSSLHAVPTLPFLIRIVVLVSLLWIINMMMSLSRSSGFSRVKWELIPFKSLISVSVLITGKELRNRFIRFQRISIWLNMESYQKRRKFMRRIWLLFDRIKSSQLFIHVPSVPIHLSSRTKSVLLLLILSISLGSGPIKMSSWFVCILVWDQVMLETFADWFYFKINTQMELVKITCYIKPRKKSVV